MLNASFKSPLCSGGGMCMAERGSVGRASISDQLKAGKAAAEQAKAERSPKEKTSRGAER